MVGFVKGYYIFRYEVNSIFGQYAYEISDGRHILAHYFSNDYTLALQIINTLIKSDDINNILTA